ncbi:hypothetical protein [Microbacterium sp. 2RAF4]|uniref:hypothetical protein n=1 Tax=Microbacterium sp. 2RAF4 TaxID=3232999 RepID=UPI003F97388A
MIGRALRAQTRSLTGDVVLLGVAVAAFAMSLTLAASIPSEVANASVDARAELAAPLSTVLATYAGILAAVYGSFRYTIDRRDGVVAQRLTVQRRWVMLLVRTITCAVGGAVVALAAVLGGHSALTIVVGGLPMEWSVLLSTLVLGAFASLWGMGIGLIVQAHLAALFVSALSMGVAVIVAMFWSTGAAYLPLLALLEAFRFDVGAVGIPPQQELTGPVALLVSAGWVLAALIAGGAAFLSRDVR